MSDDDRPIEEIISEIGASVSDQEWEKLAADTRWIGVNEWLPEPYRDKLVLVSGYSESLIETGAYINDRKIWRSVITDESLVGVTYWRNRHEVPE